MTHCSRRPLLFMLLAGVFERFPRLSVGGDRAGCSWVPALLWQMDTFIESIRSTGQIGELRFKPEHRLSKLASEYVSQSVWFGVSFPGVADVEAAREIGVDRFMWGSDYPHDEGTYPYSTLALRQVFSGWPEADVRKMLGGNAAQLYDFDLDALAGLTARFDPSVADVARPLTELSADANEALLKNARTA